MGLLLKNFSSAKEKWKTSSNHRPQSTQQVSCDTQIQDVDSKKTVSTITSGSLGHQPGFVRRLSSRSNPSKKQKVSEVCIQRESVSIPSPSIRDIYGPLCVHSSGQSTSPVCTTIRNSPPPVSRRLAVFCHEPSSNTTDIRHSPVADSRTGVESQHGKIRTDTFPRFHLHWNSCPTGSGIDVSPRRSFLQTSGCSIPSLDGPFMPPETTTISYRSSPIDGGPSPIGQITFSSTLHGDQSFSDKQIRSTPNGTCFSPIQGVSKVVDESEVDFTRSANFTPKPQLDLNNRQFFVPLGGSPVSYGNAEHSISLETNQRVMVTSDVSESHQSERIPCSSAGTVQFSTSCKVLLCPGPIRQQNNCFIDQSPRHRSISTTSGGCIQSSDVVSQKQDISASHISSRDFKCAGRQTESSKQGHLHRMVTEPIDSQSSFSDVGNSNDRPFRLQSKLQITALHQPSSGSTSICKGRIIPRLEGQISLRLPSLVDSFPATSTSQTSGVSQVQDDFGRTLLAQNALVSSRSKTCRKKKTLPTTSTKQSSISDTGQRQSSTAQESNDVEATRVATIQSALTDQGLSSDVVAYISSSVRPTTKIIYANRWMKFANWCSTKSLDPFQTSVAEIADFMVNLFKEVKLSVNTIENYRTAISHTLSLSGNNCLVDSRVIRDLLRSFHVERPVSTRSTPSWNLALVLDTMRKPPFEPIESIELANLSVKTIFLTALASSRRRSELHAMIYEGSGASRHNRSFLLPFDRLFLAKTQRLHHPTQRPLLIPALPTDDIEEKFLCPVRCLIMYSKRTQDIRKRLNAKRFFVPYKPNHPREITANTISAWLVNAIRWAYAAAGQSRELKTLHKIKAHDLRAFSSSLSFMRSVSLDDIFEAACWKCHTTFTDHYLRDLTIHSDDILRLGPLVASQRIIQ